LSDFSIRWVSGVEALCDSNFRIQENNQMEDKKRTGGRFEWMEEWAGQA